MNKLSSTLEKKIPSQEDIQKTFSEKGESLNNSTKEIKPINAEKVDRICRPTFEMPIKDHQKLKTICTFEGVNIGDKLYQIVKEWLDQRTLSFD